MKKKSLLFFLVLFITSILIGCGDESEVSKDNDIAPQIEETVAESPERTLPVDVVESAVDTITPGENQASVVEQEQSQESDHEQPQEQENTEKYIEIVAEDVRVRSSASTDTNDNILGKAQKGEKYVKTGDEGDWSKLSFKGNDGFIKSEFVKEISKEEYETKPEASKSSQETTDSSSKTLENTPQTAQSQDASADQQAAMLAQQEALLAQQQALANQQTTTNNSGSAGGTFENTQMRSDRIVYITPTGSRYHYDPECAGPNAIPKNLDDLSASYKPCGTCVLK